MTSRGNLLIVLKARSVPSQQLRQLLCCVSRCVGQVLDLNLRGFARSVLAVDSSVGLYVGRVALLLV